MDEGTQPCGRTSGRHQPALGRRTRVPGSQENRGGIDTACHVRRVAAGATRQKVCQAERAGIATERVQRRVRRERRSYGQQ